MPPRGDRKRGIRGNGSIIFLKNRKTYQIKTYRKDPISGKLIAQYNYEKDYLKADALHRQLLAKRDSGELVAGAKQTFKDYAMKYLEFDAQNRCKQTTINFYYMVLTTHYFPVFGHRPIADITSMELQEFYSRMTKNYSAKSIETFKGVGCSIFSSAERHGIIKDSPARRTQLPKKELCAPGKKRQPVWSQAEIADVMKAVYDTPWQAFFYIAITTGMRLGELTGLMWSDFDFESGTVYIQRTLVATTEFSMDGRKTPKLVFNTPKTPDSMRFLQLQPAVLDALYLHRVAQQMKMKEMGEEWQDYDLVFPDLDGSPVNPSTFRSRYRRFLKEKNLRYINPHDIRHTFAVTLIKNHSSIEQVQQALGHSDIKITKNTYANDVPSLGHEAIAAMTQLVLPGSPSAPILGVDLPRPKPTMPNRKIGDRKVRRHG